MAGFDLLIARLLALAATLAAGFLFWSALLAPAIQAPTYALLGLGALVFGTGSLVTAYLAAILHKLPSSSIERHPVTDDGSSAPPAKLPPALGIGLLVLIIGVAAMAALS